MTAHTDEIQPTWNQRWTATWMSGAGKHGLWHSWEKANRWLSQMIFPCCLWHSKELRDGNITTLCFGRRAWSWCTISRSLSLLPEWLSQWEMSITLWLAVKRAQSTQLVVMEGEFLLSYLVNVGSRSLDYIHLAWWETHFWGNYRTQLFCVSLALLHCSKAGRELLLE